MSSNANDQYYRTVIATLDDTQRNAVLSNSAMVVCAGAGSGKTRVLVAKYLYYAVELKIPLQSIVALTFTRKAANEMYERIYLVLTQFATTYPHIAEQLQSFNGSTISTIDSYCHGLVNEHYGYFNIEQPPAIDRGRYIAMAQHIAYKTVLKYSNHHPIQQLAYTKGMQTLLHSTLVTLALDDISFIHNIDPNDSLAHISQMLHHSIQTATHNILRNIEILLPYHTSIKALNVLGLFHTDRLEQLSINSTLDECAEILTPLLGLTTRFGRAQHVDHLKPLVKQTKQLAQQICDVVSYYSYAPDHQCILNMLADFQAALNRAKSLSGLFMYHDFLELSISILQNSKLFPHIECRALLVDEFQDVNTLQKNLIYLIANRSSVSAQSTSPNESIEAQSVKDATNNDCDIALHIPPTHPLCIVGDERQSIYGFRGAEYDVFRVAKEDIHTIGGEVHFLAYNYRTHSDLYQQVCRLEHKAHATLQDAVATDTQSTAAHKTTQINFDNVAPFCSIYIIAPNDRENHTLTEMPNDSMDTDDITPDATPYPHDDTYPEARYIASFIHHKVASGRFHIYDGDQVRAAQYHDFAILLRARTRLQLFERELRAYRIPFSTIGSPNASQQLFLHDHLNLLQCIISPHDYSSFIAVLKSPWIRYDDAKILRVHVELTNQSQSENRDTPNPLHTMQNYLHVMAGIDQQSASFLEQASHKVTRFTSLQLIDWLWFDGGYRLQLLATESDEYLEYVYRTLYHCAIHCSYPHQLLYYLRSQINRSPHQSSAISMHEIPRLQSEMHNGVVLSTIHAAKGLEYPVVIVADINATMRHETSQIIWQFDPHKYSVHYPQKNIVFELTKDKRRMQMENELLRLFYVAITRAQSHLILCGTERASHKTHSILSLLQPLDTLTDIPIHYLSPSSITQTDVIDTPEETTKLSLRQSSEPSTTTHRSHDSTHNIANVPVAGNYTHHFVHSFDVNATTLNAWYNHYQSKSVDQSTAAGNNDTQQHASITPDSVGAAIYPQNTASTVEPADSRSRHSYESLPTLPIDEILSKQSLHNAFGSLVHSCLCHCVRLLPFQTQTPQQIVNAHISTQRKFPSATHHTLKRSLIHLLDIFLHSSLYREHLSCAQSYDDADAQSQPHGSLAATQHSPSTQNSIHDSSVDRHNDATSTTMPINHSTDRMSTNNNTMHSNTAVYNHHSFVLPTNPLLKRTIHHEHPFIFLIHQQYAHLAVTGTIDYLHHDTAIDQHHAPPHTTAAHHAITNSHASAASTRPSHTMPSQLNASPTIEASSLTTVRQSSIRQPLLVDYKSDATIKPDAYRMQMACYQQAVYAMYGVYPRTYLYYVRSGDAIEIPIQHKVFSVLQHHDTIARLYAHLAH